MAKTIGKKPVKGLRLPLSFGRSIRSLRAACLPVAPPKGPIHYEATPNIFTNSKIHPGFPLGSIGTGVVHVGSSGGFQSATINNNWMAPVEHMRGSFWAIYVEQNGQAQHRILRQGFSGGKEFLGANPIEHVRFEGELPFFRFRFTDDLPVFITVRGFSPHIPQNVRDSSLPAAIFDVDLKNVSDQVANVAFLFSWENILGIGGTGERGIVQVGKLGLGGKPGFQYDFSDQNFQERIRFHGLRGIRFFSHQVYPEGSHQRSLEGTYLLLTEELEGLEITESLGWDASEKTSSVLEQFRREGNLDGESHVTLRTPSAALCVNLNLQPQEKKTIPFYLIWWTPNHVTETQIGKRLKTSKRNGIRVGHFYENPFSSPDSLAMYVRDDKQRLQQQSAELNEIINRSSLPFYLKILLLNSTSSVRTNTVLPRDGSLYTIEGQAWDWSFGGLTGTNDQRLTSHPYAATFFTALDQTEVDSFRRLSVNGSVPHGNGNCDLALGTADVPYGRPFKLWGTFYADRWPDLNLSYILQAYRHYVTTGNQTILSESWAHIKKMFDHLKTLENPHGIPEGGSTYDVYDFKGSTTYNSFLYLAALRAGIRLAKEQGESETASELNGRKIKVLETIDRHLWNPLGYFQTSIQRDTLFYGSLAGDFIARWIGLDPYFPIYQTRTHVQSLHPLLFPHLDWQKTNQIPLAHGEFFPEGKPLDTKVMSYYKVPPYISQVISYHLLESISLGMVRPAFDALEFLFNCFYQKGHPWCTDLWGASGFNYMSLPTLWALPNLFNGASLDVPKKSLTLNVQQLPDFYGPTQTVPIFFPGFWADVHFTPGSKSVEIRVVKNFGEKPVEIENIQAGTSGLQLKTFKLDEPFVMKEGETLSLNLSQES